MDTVNDDPDLKETVVYEVLRFINFISLHLLTI
jgi:hypothetical protein